ncbi:MAG: sugar phosphate isomerase/epimerase family protein, partial [Lawsonibacter sp.]
MNKGMRLSGPMSALRARFGDEEGIRLMARAGFDAVDYTFNEMVHPDCVWNTREFEAYAKSLCQAARAEGLYFNQAHAPFLFDWDGMWQQQGFQTDILPVVERSFHCAALLEIPLIVVHPIHHVRYRGNEAKLWEWNQEYYRGLLDAAKRHGVRIALENMWQTDPKRSCGDSDVFSQPTEFRDFLDALQDPWAVACVDVGHAGLAGEDPAQLLRTLGGDRVKAIHIHDNRYLADDHTLPYLGGLDWDSITRALGEINYRGDSTFE